MVDDVRLALSGLAKHKTFTLAAVMTFALRSIPWFAITLAGIGLYGMLAYGVARRQRELGVRSALGAPRTTLIGMVVREGMAVMLAGALVAHRIGS